MLSLSRTVQQKTAHFVYFLVIAGLLTSSCASTIKVEGKISIKGNEPFTYLSISNEDVEYEIVGDLAQKLRQDMQGQLVTLVGKLLHKETSNSKLKFRPPQFEALSIVASH